MRYVEIRTLGEDDAQKLARMLRLAFGGDETWSNQYFDRQKNPRLDPEQVLVAADGDGTDGDLILASTTVLPLEIFVDGVPHQMGGVAAVMTDPAYRRRGLAKRLLEENLADMRRRGVHLSMLDPFSHVFYRKLGWELALDSVLYTVSPTKLPKSEHHRSVRNFRSGDTDATETIREKLAATYQLCVRRSGGYSRKLHEDAGNEVAVFEAGEGGIEGYVMYALKERGAAGDGPFRTVHVREMVAFTRRAREGLLSFLSAFDPDEFEVSLITPTGEMLHPFLPDADVKAEVQTGLMLRIVDVEGALRHLKREISEPLVLEVHDDVIPENSGEFTVGDGEVRRSASGKHRVTLDVRRLAQLYAGYVPARRMAEWGEIRLGSGRALELLEGYFPKLEGFVFPVDHF